MEKFGTAHVFEKGQLPVSGGYPSCGARRVVETIMMKQRCKENGEQGVYAPLDRTYLFEVG